MNAFSCALFAQPFSVLGATKFPYRVRMFVFQLSELHIYVIPTDLWQVERRLVDTSIIEQCVSVGFVRWESTHYGVLFQTVVLRTLERFQKTSSTKYTRGFNFPMLPRNVLVA